MRYLPRLKLNPSRRGKQNGWLRCERTIIEIEGMRLLKLQILLIS